MKNRKTVGLCLLAVIGCAGLAAAADFYIEPVSVSGDPAPDKQAAVAELIRNSLQRDGHRVVPAASSSTFVLRPTLVREAELYTLTLEKTQNGQSLYSSKVGPEAMAALQTDIDTLVRSAVAGTPAPASPTPAPPAMPPAPTPPQRTRPQTQWSLGFGPAWVNHAFERAGEDKGGTKPNVALAKLWNMDPQSAALSFFVESTFIDGNDTLVNGGLAARYYFSRGDTSPFLSADLGYGAALRGDHRDDRHGFVYGGMAGLQFFRTSTVSLDTAFRVFSLAKTVESGSPVVYGLRVGLLW